MEAAASLPRHLLERDFGSSHTSAWATLLHTAWGEWLWLGRWRETPASGDNPTASQSLAELDARWAAITEQQLSFIDGLGTADLDRPVSYENPPGTAWTYALGEMVRHVVNHSTYHRGQLASLLRQLGATPPPTDYLVFFDEGAPPSPRKPGSVGTYGQQSLPTSAYWITSIRRAMKW